MLSLLLRALWEASLTPFFDSRCLIDKEDLVEGKAFRPTGTEYLELEAASLSPGKLTQPHSKAYLPQEVYSLGKAGQ